MRKLVRRVVGVTTVVMALGACGSVETVGRSETSGVGAATVVESGVVLDLSWQSDSGDQRRLIASADGSVTTSDSTSVTEYRQHTVLVDAVKAAANSAVDVLRTPGGGDCAEPDTSVRTLAVTADYEWHYAGFMAEGECRPELRQVADRIWSSIGTTDKSAPEYAERFVMYLDSAPDSNSGEPANSTPWPLRTPYSKLTVVRDDAREVGSCTVVAGEDVASLAFVGAGSPYKMVTVHTDLAGEPLVRAALVPLLPGEFSCSSGEDGTADDTIASLGGNESVVDLRTSFWMPGNGGGPVVVVRADGQAVVDDVTSPTGYMARQLAPDLVLELTRAAVAVLRVPRSDPCLILDGMFVRYRARTDQGSWMGSAGNPGSCGWPELQQLTSRLEQRIVESGSNPTPYTL